MLSPNYLSVTNADVNMLKQKKKFMNDAFDKMLQTGRWKKRVREHEGDYTTQSVNQKLNSFCIESSNDLIRGSTTLSHITLAKIES